MQYTNHSLESLEIKLLGPSESWTDTNRNAICQLLNNGGYDGHNMLTISIMAFKQLVAKDDRFNLDSIDQGVANFQGESFKANLKFYIQTNGETCCKVAQIAKKLKLFNSPYLAVTYCKTQDGRGY